MENALRIRQVNQVAENLLAATGDVNRIFRLDNGVYVAPPRIQLVAVFTLIDVLSNYWYEYLGDRGLNTSELRFIAFLTKFAFVKENATYRDRKFLGGMEITDLYSLRNSLVHFYGVGGGGRVILPNPSKLLTEEEIQTNYESFKKVAEATATYVRFVQPIELKEIAIDSSKLLLNFLAEKESEKDLEKKNSHIEGIQRIYEKIDRDGGFLFTKEDAERLARRFTNDKE